MTDTNTKVRSLILTALMVVSVFGGSIAFAGSAAAANQAGFTLEDSSQPGADTAITAEITSEQSQKSVSGVSLDFSGATDFNGQFTDSSSDYTVVVEDSSGGTTEVTDLSASSSSSQQEITLTFSSVEVNDGESLIVEARDSSTQQFTNPTSEGTYTGTIQLNPGSDGVSDTADISISGTAAGGSEFGVQSATEFDNAQDSVDTSYFQVVTDTTIDATAADFQVETRNGDTINANTVSFNTESPSSGDTFFLELAQEQDLSGEVTLDVDFDSDGTYDESFDVTTTSSTADEATEGTSSTIDTVSYQGSSVAFVGADTDTDYVVYETSQDDNGNYISTGAPSFGGSTGDNSYVTVVDSSDLTTGEVYNAQFGSNSDATQIQVRNLGLNAEADSTSVSFNEGGSASVSATVTADFGNREVDATLLDSSGDPVGSANTIEIDGDREATTEFSVSEAGNYTIEVEDVNTGITVETDTIAVSSVTGDVMFTNNIFSEDRGDVAEVTVDLANTDEAVVLVGSNSVNYYTAVTVADAESGDDADGQVTLQLNTFQTTEGGSDVFSDAAFSATGDDSVVSVESPDQAIDSISAEDVEANGQTNSPLAASDYNLAAYVGGEEQTVGTLIVNERSATGMNLWTAPASSFDSVAAPAGVYSAIDDGAITQSDEIAAGDTLVHQIQIEGVYGALAAEDTETPEQALINLLTTSTGTDVDDDGDETALSLSMVQAGSSPNQDPKRLALSESKDALNVVLDDANNTVFVNVNTADAQFFRSQEDDYSSGDTLVSASTGETFDVTLTLEPESGLTADDMTEESLSATFEVVERSGEINNGDPVMVEPGTDQVISGETSIAPGTEVTMRARATGDNPFLVSTTTTVAQNGTFEGAFDFSEVSNNTSFTVTASASPQFADGELSAEGTVANTTDEPEDTPTPTPTDMPTDEPTDEPTDTPTDMATDTPSDTEGSTPGFGGAVAIVALAGAALIALRREN
ncbi:hypothetical protein BRD20_10420 [Halobacteriales archaeon SW_8_65_20]|nr:MAG: hypothetical protein BRD20_10420 [Halobacteriales archaeon SW_8_65_20]